MNPQHCDEDFNAQLRSLTGFVPGAELDDEDVFLVGFMKSGTNWLRTLVAGVVYGADPQYVPSGLLRRLVPNHGHKKFYYRRYGTPTFFRMHDFPRPEFKRVVYLLRDGRDAMVSLRHHFSATQGREIDFLKFVRGEDEMGPRFKWHTHVEKWLANPYQAQMIVIRYEDLKRDTVNELRRFCEFVGVSRADAHLAAIAQKASFANMREKEERRGGRKRWPQDKFFVRRGEVGSHKDEMPPEVLEVFLSEAGDTLRQLGYLE